jgi:predicted RNA-binding protein (virulence factor B family)
MSKKIFKKAVGGLYKAGLVELTDGGIRLKEK